MGFGMTWKLNSFAVVVSNSSQYENVEVACLGTSGPLFSLLWLCGRSWWCWVLWFVCLFFLIEILGFVDLLENVVCQGFRCVSVVLLFPPGENQSVKQQLLILGFF